MPENFKEFADKYWMVPVLVITYWIFMYVNDILLKMEHPDATIAVGLMVYLTLFNRIRILEKRLDALTNS